MWVGEELGSRVVKMLLCAFSHLKHCCEVEGIGLKRGQGAQSAQEATLVLTELLKQREKPEDPRKSVSASPMFTMRPERAWSGEQGRPRQQSESSNVRAFRTSMTKDSGTNKAGRMY